MLRQTIVLTIVALASLTGIQLLCAEEGQNDQRLVKVASEVRVQQSRGTMPAGAGNPTRGASAKRAPEGVTNPTASGSPTTPTTCNQENAASPACYSATQQARPVTR